MAEVVDEFDFGANKRQKYPWDDWLDGRIWRLVRGEDFFADTRSMQAQVRTQAVRRGLECHSRTDGKDLVIQARQPEGL